MRAHMPGCSYVSMHICITYVCVCVCVCMYFAHPTYPHICIHILTYMQLDRLVDGIRKGNDSIVRTRSIAVGSSQLKTVPNCFNGKYTYIHNRTNIHAYIHTYARTYIHYMHSHTCITK